jgi:hypothetical protein
MARGGVDPIVRYLVLGGLGYAGWSWASAQPADSWARQMIDQARGFLKHPTLPGSSSSTSSSSSTTPAAPSAPAMLPGHWYGPGGKEVPAPAPIPTDQPMQPTSLVDVGGFPIVMDPNQDALRQDPAQGGTNVYGPGDVLVDSNTQAQYVIVAGRGGVILQGPDGAYVASDDFFV